MEAAHAEGVPWLSRNAEAGAWLSKYSVAREAGADRHRGQAARRPRQGDRPRALQLRHQPARDDLRQDRALAARARPRRVGRSVPRREKAPGVKAVLACTEAGRAGDVSGRSGRGGRRRHRGARARRRAADPRPLRSAAASSRTSSRRWRPMHRRCFPAATRGRARPKRPATSPPASPRRRTSSRRPTRRT